MAAEYLTRMDWRFALPLDAEATLAKEMESLQEQFWRMRAEAVEGAIRDLVDAMGVPPENLAKRCRRVVQGDTETFYCDGEPVYRITTTFDRFTMTRYTQDGLKHG